MIVLSSELRLRISDMILRTSTNFAGASRCISDRNASSTIGLHNLQNVSLLSIPLQQQWSQYVNKRTKLEPARTLHCKVHSEKLVRELSRDLARPRHRLVHLRLRPLVLPCQLDLTYLRLRRNQQEAFPSGQAGDGCTLNRFHEPKSFDSLHERVYSR